MCDKDCLRLLDAIITNMLPGDYTFGMLKPGFTPELKQDVTERLANRGLTIIGSHSCLLSPLDVKVLYFEHLGKSFYQRNADYIASDLSHLMLITGPGARAIWKETLVPIFRERYGSTDPDTPHCNAVHGSDSNLSALRELCWFFRW